MNIISQGACWSQWQQVHIHCLSPKGPPVTGSQRPFKLSFRSSVHLVICSFTYPALIIQHNLLMPAVCRPSPGQGCPRNVTGVCPQELTVL